MKNGWQTKTLGQVCDFRGGGTPSKAVERYWEGDIPWVSPKDMKFEVVSDSIDHISLEAIESSATSLIPKDSVLIVVRSGILARIVPIAVTGRDLTINQDLKALCPKYAIHPQFLYYLLESKMDVLLSMVSRGATVHRLTTDLIRSVEFLLPPLPEQRRIVGILDEAFEGIATAKANAEKNLQNARALFESHLHGEHAEKALLGDLVNIKTGKLDANAAVEGGRYPFFTCSREIYAIDKYAFDCEAILLAGNNAVGDFNVKHYKGKFNAYQRTYVITVNEKKRVLYRFLYFQMFKSLKKFKAQSVGAGTKFLKLGMIKDLEISLPSLDEQQRIVSTMDFIREETQRLASLYERKLAALEELKKSLLHQAFSGRL